MQGTRRVSNFRSLSQISPHHLRAQWTKDRLSSLRMKFILAGSVIREATAETSYLRFLLQLMETAVAE